MKVRASCDDFRELRESGAYYVDKTEMIAQYLEQRFEKAVLFARPRRFGKTLTMTMFRDFLDVKRDSRAIFAGLKIMEFPDVVHSYMNQYPVVFISLKEVFGDSFEEVSQNLRIAISKMCKENVDLLDSENISEVEKQFFLKVWRQEAELPNTEQALDLLCTMMKCHYGKPAFVLIDEYDVPLAKALGREYYEKVQNMVEHILSYVCKTNEAVKAVLLSGCLYTVKNSAYTGVNNIISYTILSPLYASSIGFTDGDVRKLLADVGLFEHYDEVAEWYDGYLFGREKMYCPWDVLCYVDSVLTGTYSEQMGPESYWVNTSETTVNLIHGFLGKTSGANEVFEQLLAGQNVYLSVNDNVPYHRIYEGGENLWSVLLETGYLTKAVKERMPLMPLRIPNKEIQIVFRQEVWHFFQDKVDNVFVSELAKCLWAGEVKRAEVALCQILEATLSFYHEYHEYSYHLILDGFFTGLGYRVLSELETGYGRSDLIILDPARERCLILELKHEKEKRRMEGALEEATSQIIKNKYDSQLRYGGYTSFLKYALAFCGKEARIAKVV